MNLSVIQTLASMNVGKISQSGKTTEATPSGVGATFGSVFSSVSANTTVAIPVQTKTGNQIPAETVLAIFNAGSIEELGQALQGGAGEDGKKPVEPGQTDADLVKIPETSINVPVTDLGASPITENLIPLFQSGSLKDIVEAVGIQPEKLVENLKALLKKVGVSETELEVLNSMAVDIWQMINMVDKAAPQFFEQLSASLEGKGDLPKQQVVELLAMLKVVTILAPKADLVLKQEQQVFSLGNYLNVAGERFENVLNSNVTNKNSMVQLVDGRQIMRFVSASETSQPMTDQENGRSNSGQSDMKKEAAQPAISSANAQLSAKGDFTISELESRGSNRSETLIREMQAIFRRANFGQTGGTNRLLIKLYPEHLGQVRIELLETNGILTARILASTALGKEMLDSQQAQLRQAFVQQNIQVDRLDISQTLQESNRGERDQNAFNGQFKREQQQSDEQQGQTDEEEMTFQEFMIELEV